MSIRTVAWWAALALCTTAPNARSQQPALQQGIVAYVVSGMVVDRDGNPLSGADIALVEADTVTRSVRSDAEGRFRFDGLPTAEPVFRLRRLGYDRKTVSVNVPKADRVARVVFTLDATVARLDPMVVDESEVAMPNTRLAGFYERSRSNSFGRYITEAMLAKRRPHYTSDALQGLPGVIIRQGRVGNIVRLRSCGVGGGGSPERFGPLIWVDGVRAKGAELDEVTQGEDVAAIEVYNSMAGIPVQYFDRTAVCGTILVWTKSR